MEEAAVMDLLPYRSLILRDNTALTGTLPTALGNLGQLVYVVLNAANSFCQFPPPRTPLIFVLRVFQRQRQLLLTLLCDASPHCDRVLDLSDCSLSGTVPKELSLLTALVCVQRLTQTFNLKFLSGLLTLQMRDTRIQYRMCMSMCL